MMNLQDEQRIGGFLWGVAVTAIVAYFIVVAAQAGSSVVPDRTLDVVCQDFYTDQYIFEEIKDGDIVCVRSHEVKTNESERIGGES
jgi:hypothetical protein